MLWILLALKMIPIIVIPIIFLVFLKRKASRNGLTVWLELVDLKRSVWALWVALTSAIIGITWFLVPYLVTGGSTQIGHLLGQYVLWDCLLLFVVVCAGLRGVGTVVACGGCVGGVV